MEELLFAWQVEYGREVRPMRILLVAGLNNLIKGGDFESLTTQYKRFGDNASYQSSRFHPGKNNSFAIAPLLPAPKLVWFPDNGPTTPGYVNRRDEVASIQLQERDLPGASLQHPWHQDHQEEGGGWSPG